MFAIIVTLLNTISTLFSAVGRLFGKAEAKTLLATGYAGEAVAYCYDLSEVEGFIAEAMSQDLAFTILYEDGRRYGSTWLAMA